MNKAGIEIINILSAIGCKPAATTDNTGNTIIKVNAPTVNAPKGDNSKK